MLKIRDLYVRYGGIEAVQGVSLDIKRGSIVTLVGANGAGKSSIIRSIAGLNKNISGEISLTRKEGDEPVSLIGLKPEEMVRRGISLSPEGRRILPHLTVVENLRLGAYSRTDKDGINEDIERVYALFPRLKERHWQKGGTLSGGEQQMLAVGRALMSRPDMIMLDEPSLGLAPLLVKEIFNIIRCWWSRTRSRPFPWPITPTSSKWAAWCWRAPARSCWRTPRSRKPIWAASSGIIDMQGRGCFRKGRPSFFLCMAAGEHESRRFVFRARHHTGASALVRRAF